MPSGGNGERPEIPAEVAAGAAAEIAHLVAAGDYQGAARRAAAAGDLRRAIALCERIWRFADAIPWALELGDYALAVRLCLDAGAPARAREVVSQLLDLPAPDSTLLLAVAEVLARRGLVLDAAALALRAGAPTRAAELFHAGGAFVEAARARIAAGAFADAGRLLEEVAGAAARQGEIAEEAEARLELGILCGRLGRFRDGARALQIAARHPPLRTIALAHLETQLASLDLPHAAAAVREELRQRPSSPTSVAGEIGAATANASAASGTRQTNLASSAPAPASSPLPALPRFADLALIGGGRLGRVFRARDRLLGETVVLKVMGVGVSGHGQEQQAFRQFLLQAEASSRLRHPNIVRLIDVDERAGLLVMEYISGGTLADRLAQEGRLRPAGVRRLALDLLAALAAAHRAGIVHRDVKPPNVFLDAAGNAKLADFGAAHLADFGGTQTAGFIGTLGYLSPEQIAGGRIGPAADLYALGATLFEALVGRLPFVAGDIAGQHLGAPPPRPSTLAPELDPRHDEVLLRALAKSPADRFASADEMAAAIRAWPAALAEPAVARAIPREPEPAAASGAHGAHLTPAPLPSASLVGATASGQLWSRIDDRLGAPVLVEVLQSPLDEAGIERIGRIAAAGSPHVQRVLRLEDPATIVYEALVGPLVALDSLPPEEQALLAAPLVSLAPCGIPSASPTMIVSTPAGPVIPVVVLLGPA